MTTDYKISQARPADAAAIRQLTRDAYAKWIPVIGREPKPMGADYDAAVLQHRFDLLFANEDLVGLIETLVEGEQLLIVNVAVAPNVQGRGLGTRLMAHADALARSLGHPRVRLYTNKRFEQNIALYTKLGFTIEGEAQGAEAGTIRVDMSKAL